MSILLGTVQPLNLYDKNGIKVVLHFGKDNPRPDVLVMVVSIMSTNESPVTKCTFQAAVPKVNTFHNTLNTTQSLPKEHLGRKVFC